MRSCCLWALLLTSLAGADSLYTAQSPFAAPFADRKATRVGDVVQILIAESAQANQSANDQTANKNNATMGPGQGLLDFLPLVGYSGNLNAQSSGSTTRSASFTTRLAATVVGVAPNGNLLVEGSREVRVHKDFQVIKLSGEVRPSDILSDNTVPSCQIANARISYTGSDPRHPGSKAGLLTGLLHWLF
ncbi:MAG: flagellar basal body L-ring protein FlgH [Armatimonadota bacterium]